MRYRDAVTGTVHEVGGGAPEGPDFVSPPPGLRAVRDRGAVWVFFRGETYRIELAPARPAASALEAEQDLVAPMPGKVAALLVKEGERVEKGATLLILEAMKMEHPVRAPRAGVVTALEAAEGAMVAPGQRLLEIT
jgi:3-methylcrotonyl-CoA carboxylase alpha subunit